jgi:putative membrane protein
MNDKKDTSTAMNNDSETSMKAAPVDKDDADFAVAAANGGMAEVAMGQLAQQNGMSQRVKDFGAMMVRDHTNLGNKLETLAKNENITLPGSLGNDAQKEVDNLSKKSGKDFDKAYMNMMLDDHKTDIKDFQKAAADCKDGGLKNFALQSLPTLQIHLDSAIAITGKK